MERIDKILRFVFYVLLVITVIVGFNSFRSGSDSPNLILHEDNVTTKPHNGGGDSQNSKDIDVEAYCSKNGIPLTVDEQEIVERYGNVQLDINFGDKVNFQFTNNSEAYYVLDIYDMNGNPVLTISHINNNNISVDAGFFASGEYIYKLSGEGNTFAGKFSYE